MGGGLISVACTGVFILIVVLKNLIIHELLCYLLKMLMNSITRSI